MALMVLPGVKGLINYSLALDEFPFGHKETARFREKNAAEKIFFQ